MNTAKYLTIGFAALAARAAADEVIDQDLMDEAEDILEQCESNPELFVDTFCDEANTVQDIYDRLILGEENGVYYKYEGCSAKMDLRETNSNLGCHNEGFYQELLLCYEEPEDGYSCLGALCSKDSCPSGMSGGAGVCWKQSPYLRIIKSFGWWGRINYYDCADGYYRWGDWCRPDNESCPSTGGWTDRGLYCENIHSREVQQLSCADGFEWDGLTCRQTACDQGDYDNFVWPWYCIGDCPADHEPCITGTGILCLKEDPDVGHGENGHDMCAAYNADVAESVASWAINIATVNVLGIIDDATGGTTRLFFDECEEW